MKPADLDALARTIYGEARNQGWEGMVAVGWAVRNRVDLDLREDGKPDWWGEGYEAVCKKPWQFSCWLSSDPNLPKLLKATPALPAFRDSVAAAALVIAGLVPDPTRGSHHYHTASVSPAWAKGRRVAVQIGDHLFYNDMGIP